VLLRLKAGKHARMCTNLPESPRFHPASCSCLALSFTLIMQVLHIRQPLPIGDSMGHFWSTCPGLPYWNSWCKCPSIYLMLNQFSNQMLAIFFST
jgi:hypothetical protein